VDDDYYVSAGMRLCLMACSHAARTKFLILFSPRAARFPKHNTKGWLKVKIESHVFAQGLIVVDAARGKIVPRRVIFGLITIYHELRFS